MAVINEFQDEEAAAATIISESQKYEEAAEAKIIPESQKEEAAMTKIISESQKYEEAAAAKIISESQKYEEAAAEAKIIPESQKEEEAAKIISEPHKYEEVAAAKFISESQKYEEVAAAKIIAESQNYEEVAAAMMITKFQKDEELAAAKMISEFQKDKEEAVAKMISKFQKDEEVGAANDVGVSDEDVLAAVLARKGEPLSFLQAVIDVARKRSDLFREPSAAGKVAAMAAAARAEVVEEERRVKKEEEARKVAAEGLREKEVRSVVVEQEGNRLRKPNAENGLDLETYSWTQRLPEVNVTVTVPKGTKASFVICEIKKDHLKVGLKGQSPKIDGELYLPVKVGECFWSIEDGQTLSILLTKQNQKEWWKSLVKGDPEMDIHKVKPITEVSELDPDTRETIQKALNDRRRKEMGLPTSDEIQNQELLRNLMAQHPKMVENMARGY